MAHHRNKRSEGTNICHSSNVTRNTLLRSMSVGRYNRPICLGSVDPFQLIPTNGGIKRSMFKQNVVLIAILALGVALSPISWMGSASAQEAGAPAAGAEIMKAEGTNLQVSMKTNKGVIVIDLIPDKAPLTVANFVNLSLRKYYDGLTFHRVIANFMIQGGDPTGTGRGGPGYKFKDECVPELKFDKPGYLAMANAGPNTNGSQFFITHVPTPHLNGKHTIFGVVKEGQDVVNAIRQGDKIESIEIKGDYTALFDANKAQLDEWNAILDKNKK